MTKKGKIMSKRYYHKATLTGLLNLIYDFNPIEPIACSTEDSVHLFGRNIVVILNTKIKPCTYNANDIDAHSDTAWDEARIIFETVEELKEAIEYIILPTNIKLKEAISGKLLQKFNNGEPLDKTEKYIEKYFKNKKNMSNEFNTEVITLSEAKRINPIWNKTFLNIQ